MDIQHQELAAQVGERAANLFAAGEMLCAPAVLSSVNQGLGGGLSPEQALAVAGALPEGMGGAGCSCGALTGAQMALGLMLGGPGVRWKRMAPLASRLHDAFKAEAGSTCCRVLSKKVKGDHDAHMAQCTQLTRRGAELAAEIILAARPELAANADQGWLGRRTNRLASGLRKLLGAA